MKKTKKKTEADKAAGISFWGEEKKKTEEKLALKINVLQSRGGVYCQVISPGRGS